MHKGCCNLISNKMQKLAQNNSVIRAMFEEGKQMAAEFGAENVYDFSLGNPSVPAPAAVSNATLRASATLPRFPAPWLKLIIGCADCEMALPVMKMNGMM